MKQKVEAIVIDDKDNVAVVLDTIGAGRMVTINVGGRAEKIRLLSEVPKGHKFALKDIGAGETVMKYGQPIGRTTAAIRSGEHVHTHNMASDPRGGKQ